jgi:hypothetical protein
MGVNISWALMLVPGGSLQLFSRISTPSTWREQGCMRRGYSAGVNIDPQWATLDLRY